MVCYCSSNIRTLLNRAVLCIIDFFLSDTSYNRRKCWTGLLLDKSASNDWTDKTKNKFVKEVLSGKREFEFTAEYIDGSKKKFKVSK